MAIYRGNGGASDVTSGITLNEVTALTLRAETASDEAAASATAAAASEAGVAADAAAAFTSSENAASSATDSAESAAIASALASQVATTYDQFDDRYLGVKTSDPTVDNDGDPLVTGALYFNSDTGNMKVIYDGSWINVAPTITTIISYNSADGGFANSVYTATQSINGGTANG